MVEVGSIGSIVLQRLFSASVDVVVLTVIVAAAIRLLRIRSPRWRAMLWLIVLAKPIVTLTLGTVVPLTSIEPVALSSQATTIERAVEHEVIGPSENTAGPAVVTAAHTRPWRSLALLVWCVSIGMGMVAIIAGRRRARRVLRRADSSTPAVTARAHHIAKEMNIRRVPPIIVSDILESPALVGSRSPHIVVPAWLSTDGLTPTLDWSLRHELGHFKHKDHILGRIVEIAQVLFFFHPLVWIAARLWRDNTEMACDRAVARTAETAVEYAEALYEVIVQVRDRRRVALAGSFFATRSQIGRRIEALLTEPARGTTRMGRVAIVSFVVFTAGAMLVGAEFADKSKSESHIEIRENGDRTISIDYHEESDGHTRRINTRGKITFSKDKTAIAQMAKRSRLTVFERDGNTERHLVLTPDDHGRPVPDYKVNGEKEELDDEGKAWLSRMLQECLGERKKQGDWMI